MIHNADNHWVKHFDFLFLDFFCFQAMLLASLLVSSGKHRPFSAEGYPRLGVVVALLFFCMAFLMEPYSGILRRGFLEELRKVIYLSVAILAGLIIYLFATKTSSDYSRRGLFFFWLWSTVLVYFVRVLWKRWVRRRTIKGGRVSKLILVTSRKNLPYCQVRMGHNLFGSKRLDGIILLDDPEGELTGQEEEPPGVSFQIQGPDRKLQSVPILGGEEDLVEYCSKHVVDDVLFYGCSEQTKRYSGLLYNMGITVHFNLVNVESNFLTYYVEDINGIMVLSAGVVQTTVWQRFLKRTVDIIGGAIGCLVTLILALFVAPVIKTQAPGPVFFAQTRVGRNGRQFQIYKFRSMYTDAEERKKELMAQNKMQGQMFKMDDDPRIFPFGHFLRKTSLDEFPQFFNVLKGDMSLVGTRPPTVDEYLHYEPMHKSRLAMKPGITGLWQVSGRSDITDFEEVVRLDNEYIRNWSLTLDLKILLRTVLVVFKGEGSE